MKTTTTIYYNVSNLGDGSAAPNFFLSEELAELSEESEDEGFGESTGSFVIESDGPIKVRDLDLTSAQELYDSIGVYRTNAEFERIKARLVELGAVPDED